MGAPDGQPGSGPRSSADARHGGVLGRLRGRASYRTALFILVELIIVPRTPTESTFRRLWRNARVGLLIVLVIEGLLAIWTPFGEDYTPVRALSYMKQLFVPTQVSRYSFVDIDDATFSHWQRAGHTDRAQIHKLLERIANAQPKAVVVDIDLSDPSLDTRHDRELISYVSEYSKHANNPPLIFVRSLRAQPDRFEPAPLEAAAALFETLKFHNPPHSPVYFAASGFLRSDDGKIRSWLLAEPVCKKEHGDPAGRLITMPSVELLLLPVSDGELDAGLVNEQVQTAFSGDCSSVRTNMHEIRIGDGSPIRLSPKHLRDNIVFSIRMPPPPFTDGSVSNGLRYLRAERVLSSAQSGEDARFFKNKIVVIGGSNRERRDIYSTPLGMMPGAVVLINAIESLRMFHQLKHLSFIIEFFVGVAIGLLVWVGLEVVRIEIGLLPVYCVGYPAAIILSIFFLYFGIWFSVSGVIAGGVAHLIWKAALNIWGDIPKGPHYRLRDKLRAFLSAEFRGEDHG